MVPDALTPGMEPGADGGHLGKLRGMLASHEKKHSFVADTCGALYVNRFSA